MSLYHHAHARTPEQAARMAELEAQGTCRFCWETRHTPPGDWKLRPCDYPYEGTREHLLAIPQRHVTSMGELFEEEFAGLGALLSVYEGIYRPDGYTIAVRNGDMSLTGASVQHLHLHILVPDGTRELTFKAGTGRLTNDT